MQPGCCCCAPQTTSHPFLCHGLDTGHGPCLLTIYHGLCLCQSDACNSKMHMVKVWHIIALISTRGTDLVTTWNIKCANIIQC